MGGVYVVSQPQMWDDIPVCLFLLRFVLMFDPRPELIDAETAINSRIARKLATFRHASHPQSLSYLHAPDAAPPGR